jgi:hypothetical protein
MISIVPVKYDRHNPQTDFSNMIKDAENNKKSLYLFNDNSEHHYIGHYGGSGNAFLRLNNWHSKYAKSVGKPLSAGISTGYQMGDAFEFLDEEVKNIIDRDFNDIYYILNKYPEIDTIYYSIGVSPYSQLFDLIADNDDCIVLPDGRHIKFTDDEKNNIIGQSTFSVSENVRGYITKKIWELSIFCTENDKFRESADKSFLSQVSLGDRIV